MRTLLLSLLSIFALVACQKDHGLPDPSFFAYDYYPLEIGNYWIYQVDSSIYDPVVNGKPYRTSSNIVRVMMIDTFRDGADVLNYVLEFAFADSSGSNWTPYALGRASRTKDEAYFDEANRKLVKMTFPPVVGTHWDGTRFLDDQSILLISGEPVEMYKEWDPQVLSTDQPDGIGQQTYDKVLTIQYANAESRIEKRFAQEKYIRGVGLAYREYWILDTQLNTDERPWDQKAQRGFILKQTLIDHN